MKETKYEWIAKQVLVPDDNPSFPKGFTKVVTKCVKVAVDDAPDWDMDDEDIIIQLIKCIYKYHSI